MKNNEKGITLAMLVVTIIVMLILAGVTLKELSEDGVVYEVKNATQNQQKTIDDEQKKMDEEKNEQLKDWGF
ncbi:MAG: hypothetical protein IKG56_02890 [Clostridia bacterium]|nr:hypothetical protein [Clostridia bacterium]